MYTPNPILLTQTPPSGFILPVSSERGGLAGYILLGQLGPPATVEVSEDGDVWSPLTYPYTLIEGEGLRITRTMGGAVLTTLRALAPLDDGPVPEPGTDDMTLPLWLDDPVTVPALSSGARQAYALEVPYGLPTLSIALSGGTGDLDLFVRYGQPVVLSDDDPNIADGESEEIGNEEVVVMTQPQEGVWHILVRAFENSAGATLTASGAGSGGEPFTVDEDDDGYQTITNATATADQDGYQTIPDATATADPDGYQSVERSN